VKVAFDTSVIVAGLLPRHPRHELARPWLAAAVARSVQGSAALHALAETFAVISRLPGAAAIPAEAARRVVDEFAAAIRLIEPKTDLYRAALARCAERDLRSGAVFDAIHLLSAERARAETLLTFNGHGFERMRLGDLPRIEEPGELPR
jgi:predicted nucleic acid-binding protein